MRTRRAAVVEDQSKLVAIRGGCTEGVTGLWARRMTDVGGPVNRDLEPAAGFPGLR